MIERIEILRVGGDLHVFFIGDVAQCYYLCSLLHCLGCMFNRLQILIHKRVDCKTDQTGNFG